MFSPTGYIAVLADDVEWDDHRHVLPLGDFQLLPIVGWDGTGRALVAEESAGNRVVLTDYVEELGWKLCRVLPSVPWEQA